MHKLFFLAILFSLVSEANVNDLPWQYMSTVGKSTLRVAIWDIYEVELLAENGRYQEQNPYALRIKYLRPIDNITLLKETEKQWKKMHSNIETYNKNWLTKLSDIFPNVEKNDEITFFVDRNNHSKFYLNNHYLGRIEDPEFSQYFSGIWLSTKTTRPKLRKNLIGE